MKKMCALVLALMLCCGLFAGCQQTPVASSAATDAVSQTQQKPAVEKQLKYVFLFIGDGMSYPQFQAAADYLGALAEDGDGILNGSQALNFMQFPVAGSANTYDSTSFCPDSASTATSISTGILSFLPSITTSRTSVLLPSPYAFLMIPPSSFVIDAA